MNKHTTYTDIKIYKYKYTKNNESHIINQQKRIFS